MNYKLSKVNITNPYFMTRKSSVGQHLFFFFVFFFVLFFLLLFFFFFCFVLFFCFFAVFLLLFFFQILLNCAIVFLSVYAYVNVQNRK